MFVCCSSRLCKNAINYLKTWHRQLLTGLSVQTASLPGIKCYEDGYEVRPMRIEDTKYPTQNFATIGIMGRDDIRVAFKCAGPEPGQGFYVGEIEGKVVSSIAYIELVPNVFLGTLYFVQENYRDHKFRTRLRKHVEPILLGADKTIVADTYEYDVSKGLMGQPEAGWEIHWHSQRSVGYLPRIKQLPKGIVPVEDVPFDKLVAYDNLCYLRPDVPQRRHFLDKWISLLGGATYVCLNDNGDITGYGCRRRAIQSNVHMVGPLYADDIETADKILRSLSLGTNRGDQLTVEFWETNEAAAALLKKHNFQQVFRLYHMSQNGPATMFNPRVFGVTSLDVCNF